MKLQSAALVGLMAAVLMAPGVSQAALKAYRAGGLPGDDALVGNFDPSPVFGTSNFFILRTITLSPTVQPSNGNPDFLRAVLG